MKHKKFIIKMSALFLFGAIVIMTICFLAFEKGVSAEIASAIITGSLASMTAIAVKKDKQTE